MGEDVALLGAALEGEPIVTVLVTGVHGDLLVGFELSVLLKVVYMEGRVEQLVAVVRVEMVFEVAFRLVELVAEQVDGGLHNSLSVIPSISVFSYVLDLILTPGLYHEAF